MQYGYFDDQQKEYVITRPDTPQSWSNYLGSTEYGAIITNNAGGYGFYRSGARGRFLRMRFNSIPMDQPGRYFYMRDLESGDYWSASWQPVGKPLDQYSSTCRHGTAYTILTSHYSGITSEATYFVPLDQAFEYWHLRLTNTGDRPRQLSVFSFCEFTNQWDTQQDQVNLQYSLFIVRGEMTDDRLLRIAIQDNLTPTDCDTFVSDMARHTWMGLAGASVDGYDTSREAFLGAYRGYHNPMAVERGKAFNSQAYGDNACGSLQSDLTLLPGESRELVILLGIGDARKIGVKTFREFGTLERCRVELKKLRAFWHAKLDSLTVQTPDEEFNHTINVWGLYNSLIAYAWSRSASLVYNGERDGLGFRDSVQDVLGVVAATPTEAGDRLELMLTAQLSNGGALPVVKPFEHQPGKTPPPPDEEYRSDDCLWFFNAIPAYVAETGDLSFFRKMLPYADQGEASVLGHLRRALEFNLERTGKHGLPCGLAADWNDCLRLGYHGESVFVAFQVYLGLGIYTDIAAQLDLPEEESWATTQRQILEKAIMKHTWDGGWFIWAIGEDGTIYGSHTAEEGSIYLNTQLWAVISGMATPDQTKECLEAVSEHLATPYGLMLAAPPFVRTSIDVMRAVVYNPGIKENAGIFNHTQGWGVMAECLAGNGDRAYRYFRASMPAAYNTCADVRQSEPYVQAQTTYSTFSPRPGNTRTSWLTGAAAWSYFSATQYILGIKPTLDGLLLDPCIPSHWDGYTATRKFRGKTYHLTVHNPQHICRGVSVMQVDGKEQKSNLIPPDRPGDECRVEIWLGGKKP
jgi:N,N'-diacetylchitobiose phosphorylase